MNENDLFALVRKSDPETSLDAAVKALRASKEAVVKVREAFATGRDMTDEEVWKFVRTCGYLRSQSVIRHARKALVDAGVIVDSGERRPTQDGGKSIVWTLKGE